MFFFSLIIAIKFCTPRNTADHHHLHEENFISISSSSSRRKFQIQIHLHKENLTDIYFRLIGKGKNNLF